jgi:short-subunit dehydrogenase
MKDTALVTGASSGIGEDLARIIAANGDNVVLLARSAGKLQALADELSRAHNIVASVLTADLSLPGAGEDVAGRLAGRGVTIDILVNNAGFGTIHEFWRDDPQVQTQVLQVNVVSLTTLTRLLLPGMLERRKGRILNVASTAAFQPGPFMAVYYASKAYVLSLSEALAEETAGTGVTVTCLCPGPTRTGFQDRAQMHKVRLLSVMSVMTSAEVARAGYDGMMAGRSLVIPGLRNKIGVQSLRLSPRRLTTKIVKSLNAEV